MYFYPVNKTKSMLQTLLEFISEAWFPLVVVIGIYLFSKNVKPEKDIEFKNI